MYSVGTDTASQREEGLILPGLLWPLRLLLLLRRVGREGRAEAAASLLLPERRRAGRLSAQTIRRVERRADGHA